MSILHYSDGPKYPNLSVTRQECCKFFVGVPWTSQVICKKHLRNSSILIRLRKIGFLKRVGAKLW